MKNRIVIDLPDFSEQELILVRTLCKKAQKTDEITISFSELRVILEAQSAPNAIFLENLKNICSKLLLDFQIKFKIGKHLGLYYFFITSDIDTNASELTVYVNPVIFGLLSDK